MKTISQTLLGLVILFTLTTCPIHSQEDTDHNWKPVVILIIPQDNKSVTTWGHTEYRCSIFPSGQATLEKDVFGQGPGDSLKTAWLSESRINSVIALANEIRASRAMAKRPGDAVILEGSAMGNKRIVRDCRQNLEDVTAMLRLIGGIWPDIDPVLPEPTLNHS